MLFSYRAQDDSSSIFSWQPGSQAVDRVLVNTVRHVEHNHADQSEVEEGRGPAVSLHHGQDDGDDEHNDFH